MTNPIDPDRIGFEIRTGPAHAEWREPRSERPFRILLVGDFSGRGASRPPDSLAGRLADRKPILVDRDDLDRVMERLAPVLHLRIGDGEAEAPGDTLTLTFAELDDFHPDRLYQRVPEFRALQRLRRQAADPGAAPKPVPAERHGGAAPAEAPRTTADTAGGSLLDRIVGGEDPAPNVDTDFQALVNRVVSRHSVPDTTSAQQATLTRLDGLAAEAMRAVLHHPRYQALESLWRGVDFMVRRIETGPDLQLHLLDMSREELVADQATERPLDQTGLYRLLVDATAGTAGAGRWSLLVGAYTWGGAPGDVAVLERLAELGRAAGAPWLSAAHPHLVGAGSFPALADLDGWSDGIDPAWAALRRHGDAAHLGLVLPRFLMRLPYGQDTDPCEAFDFEEFEGEPSHAGYLWGNPALAAAVLLAESFLASGWSMRPGSHLDLGGLPLHLYRSGVETVAKPCAEVWFQERAARRVMECGVMPLVSMKDSDKVRLVRFQSIADPPSALAGPWT
jgi:type VI secretion system protein ImpC